MIGNSQTVEPSSGQTSYAVNPSEPEVVVQPKAGNVGGLGVIEVKDKNLVVDIPISSRYNNDLEEIDPHQAILNQRDAHRANARTFILGSCALLTSACSLPILGASLAAGAGFSAAGITGVTFATCLPSLPLCLAGTSAALGAKKYVRDSYIASQVLRHVLNWKNAIPWNNTVEPENYEVPVSSQPSSPKQKETPTFVEVYDNAPQVVPPPPPGAPNLEVIVEEEEDIYEDTELSDGVVNEQPPVVMRVPKARPLSVSQLKLELYEPVETPKDVVNVVKKEGPYEPITIQPSNESTL